MTTLARCLLLYVKCSQGKRAAVSEIDYARVTAQKWYASRSRSTGVWYAHNRDGVGMHRYVMRAKKGQVVDHIDGQGLNNVRENLRICTTEENNANWRVRQPRRGGGAPLIGVRPCKGGFQATVSYRGQKIKGGIFSTPEEAARVEWVGLRQILNALHVPDHAIDAAVSAIVWSTRPQVSEV